MTEEFWYRVQETHYAAPLDEYDRPCGEGSTIVRLYKYRVISHTPKGVWVWEGVCSGKRFVRTEARKRFACPTVEEAIASFQARKARQLGILNAQIKKVNRALKYLNDHHLDS